MTAARGAEAGAGATKLKRVRQRVEPKLPVDVMGVYVCLPAREWVMRGSEGLRVEALFEGPHLFEPIETLVDLVEMGIHAPFEGAYGLSHDALDVRQHDLAVEPRQDRDEILRHGRDLTSRPVIRGPMPGGRAAGVREVPATGAPGGGVAVAGLPAIDIAGRGPAVLGPPSAPAR